MNPNLPENIIGMALGIAVVVLGIWTAFDILRAILVSLWHDLRGWRAARQIPKGWQPSEHPRGPRPWLGIRRPR